jgi:hypothetical protein
LSIFKAAELPENANPGISVVFLCKSLIYWRFFQESYKRETGVEPATLTLGRLHSTIELLPQEAVLRYIEREKKSISTLLIG